MRAGAKAVAPMLVGIVPLGLVSEGGYRDDIAIVPCYVAAWATLASV